MKKEYRKPIARFVLYNTQLMSASVESEAGGTLSGNLNVDNEVSTGKAKESTIPLWEDGE